MPNSPREIGEGEVIPREIQPEMASKSKVRQTMCLLIRATLADSGSPLKLEGKPGNILARATGSAGWLTSSLPYSP
jgi:hypothetical protein